MNFFKLICYYRDLVTGETIELFQTCSKSFAILDSDEKDYVYFDSLFQARSDFYKRIVKHHEPELNFE